VTTVNTAVVHDAVYQLLTSALAPIAVGDGTIPTPPEGDDRRPGLGSDGTWRGYLVLYRIPAGALYWGDGYIGQAESIQTVRFQLVGVGVQQNQASHIAALAAAVLIDRGDTNPAAYVHPLTIPGHSVLKRSGAGEAPGDTAGGTFSAAQFVDVMVSIA
jgi:hypothetical protein